MRDWKCEFCGKVLDNNAKYCKECARIRNIENGE